MFSGRLRWDSGKSRSLDGGNAGAGVSVAYTCSCKIDRRTLTRLQLSLQHNGAQRLVANLGREEALLLTLALFGHLRGTCNQSILSPKPQERTKSPKKHERDQRLIARAPMAARLPSRRSRAHSLKAGTGDGSMIRLPRDAPEGPGRLFAHVSVVDNVSGDPTNLW